MIVRHDGNEIMFQQSKKAIFCELFAYESAIVRPWPLAGDGYGQLRLNPGITK